THGGPAFRTHGPNGQKQIAIGFDDGPSDETLKILRVLRQYDSLVLSKDELAELEPQRSRTIEIQDFVDLDDIDPIYFEQPYYLGPDRGAERAYALLVQAMKEARKVAVARFVLRNKEHLAAIRPLDDVLTLTTMRFHDEVTSPRDLDGEVFEEAKPKK